MPERRPLPKAVRLEALQQAGGRCVLCGSLLVSVDVHHMRFLSMGGTDDVDNLAAICPACHRTVAHQIYGSPDIASIRLAVERGKNMRKIERTIVRAADGGSATSALLSDDWRRSCLTQGAYERTMAWCDFLLGRQSELTGDDIVRLYVLKADMALYCLRSPEMLPLLGDLRARGPYKPDLNSDLSFTMARYLHNSGAFEEERAVLSDVPPESAEAQFRLVSANLVEAVHGSSRDAELTNEDVLAVGYWANAQADLGRRSVALGDLEGGYAQLEQSWSLAKRIVHRRGMLITGLKLAEVSMRLNRPDVAVNWLKLATTFSSAGLAHEVSPAHLVIELQRLGLDDSLNRPLRLR